MTPKDVPSVSNSTHERSSRLGQRQVSQIVARKCYGGKVRWGQKVLKLARTRSGCRVITHLTGILSSPSAKITVERREGRPPIFEASECDQHLPPLI